MVNRWIVGQLADAVRSVTEALDDYRFNDAANAAYQFTWHTFCDWYLEFTKPLLAGGDVEARAETRAATAWVLDQILHLLHPFMPFVTEELWEALAPVGGRPTALIAASWPQPGAGLDFAEARAELGWVVRLISDIRAVRAEMNVPPAAQIPLLHRGASEETENRLERHRELIERLARIGEIRDIVEPPKGALQIVIDETTFMLPLGSVVDLDQERARLGREIARLDGEIRRIDGKLANENFISRAPAEVIEENREKRGEYEDARQRLADALNRLGPP
jgi:valyl-tRNA synthetase